MKFPMGVSFISPFGSYRLAKYRRIMAFVN
jgi:hypothetical protein